MPKNDAPSRRPGLVDVFSIFLCVYWLVAALESDFFVVTNFNGDRFEFLLADVLEGSPLVAGCIAMGLLGITIVIRLLHRLFQFEWPLYLAVVGLILGVLTAGLFIAGVTDLVQREQRGNPRLDWATATEAGFSLIAIPVVCGGLLVFAAVREARDQEPPKTRTSTERTHASPRLESARYGPAHKNLRAAWKEIIRDHGTTCREHECVMRTREIPRGTAWDQWDLAHDHTDAGEHAYLGPAHKTCNQVEALRRGVTWEGAPDLDDLLAEARLSIYPSTRTHSRTTPPRGDPDASVPF